MRVPLNKSITIGELVENTRAYMGDKLFSSYSGFHNNCQDFVIAILTSNKLINPQLKQFVKQPIDELVKKLPKISEKIVDAITDTGAVADVITRGGLGKKKKRKH